MIAVRGYFPRFALASLLLVASACRLRPPEDGSIASEGDPPARDSFAPRPFERCEAPRPATSAPVGAGSVSNVDAVVAALKPAFRACYQAALARDRDEQGCVVVQARVERGRVVSASVGTVHGLDDAMAECVRATVSSASFGASETARLAIPVTFVVRAPPP